MAKKKDTVGKIASDLMKQDDVAINPVEMQEEMLKDYEKNILLALNDAKKAYNSDCFIIVLTKREPLLPNVLRNYFSHRRSCPTPDYDQIVYHYDKLSDVLRFLWVVPSKESCKLLKDHAHELPPEQRDLLVYVLQFYDGTLLDYAKRYNGEKKDSILLEKD